MTLSIKTDNPALANYVKAGERFLHARADDWEAAVAGGANQEGAVLLASIAGCKVDEDGKFSVTVNVKDGFADEMISKGAYGKRAMIMGFEHFIREGVADLFFFSTEGWAMPKDFNQEEWKRHRAAGGEVRNFPGRVNAVQVNIYSRFGTVVLSQKFAQGKRVGDVEVFGHSIEGTGGKPLKFQGTLVMEPMLLS